jgi:hypothetical protein
LLFGTEKENYKTINNLNTIEVLNGKNVFLYNRSNISSSLSSSRDKMKLSTIFEQNYEIPEISEILNKIDNIKILKIEKSENSIKNSLFNYDYQFKIISQKIVIFVNCLNEFVKFFNEIVKENENYLEASRAVITNLNVYCGEIKILKNFFDNKFSEIEKINDKIILNFDQDLEKLSKIELHKNIKNENYKKLIDYIEISQLKNKNIEHKNMYENLKNRINDFNKNYENFDKNVNKLNEMENYFLLKKNIDEFKINIQKYKDEIINYNNINNTVKENINIITTSLNNNENILETCHKMDNIFFYNYFGYYSNNIHNNIESILLNLEENSVFANNIKKELIDNLNKTIAEVSIYQNEIVKLKNALFIFDSTTITIQKSLQELNFVSKMPYAYKESLFEISRRKKFKNNYMTKINSFKDEISKIYENEIKNRELFKNDHQLYLPKKYINFNELPNKINFEIKEFDQNFPEIEDNSEIIVELINDILDNAFKEIPENISVIYSDDEDCSDSEYYLNYFNTKNQYENKLLERIKELENEIKELKK